MSLPDEDEDEEGEGGKKDNESSFLPLLATRTLLDLCDLSSTFPRRTDDDNSSSSKNDSTSNENSSLIPSSSLSSFSREERMAVLRHWQDQYHQPLLSLLLLQQDGVDRKSGCYPLHWAAGTGFDEAVALLLDIQPQQQEQQQPQQQQEEEDDDNDNDRTTDSGDFHSMVGSNQRLLCVNQRAQKPSSGRTPLHYAARNGHLSTCILLVEGYGADPTIRCHKGGVTPLQLAVWQNQLQIVQYLVERISADHPTSDRGERTTKSRCNTNNPVLERNEFACGLNHWVGLVPKHRWLSDDGSGVLPLARYLHQRSTMCHLAGGPTRPSYYDSTPDNQQNQGHTPLHKAAWGGNIPLMAYYCIEHGVLDTVQDTCGNYAADLALMGGHKDAHQWLLQFASQERQRSCEILGLDCTMDLSKRDIQARYRILVRQYHPDKRRPDRTSVETQQDGDTDMDSTRGDDFVSRHCDGNDEYSFLRIQTAYEHLMHHDGVGSQRNPKHESLRLLTASKEPIRKCSDTSTNYTYDEKVDDSTVHKVVDTEDDLFVARILVVISDYGEKGFPVSCIAKRWNQIWPDRPFPTPEEYLVELPITVIKSPTKEILVCSSSDDTDNQKSASTTTSSSMMVTTLSSPSSSATLATPPKATISKRVKLLKFLKWKCGNAISFRKINGVMLAFAAKETPSFNGVSSKYQII
jgi:ankyrin repeat protein